LAIVGYMGSGKTTLGRLLARATGLEFVDLDRAISKRDLEREALREALDGEGPCIVACGGGVVMTPENRALLQGVTTVFLREDIGVLYGRTRGPGRPLRAASRVEFESRYAERLPFYREVADLEVEVDGRSPSRVAEEVLGCL
jgi:shikimate kinase